MRERRTLAARYMALLRAEGYRPELDRTDDQHAVIYFKSEGLRFILFVDEEDEAFFHLGIGFNLEKDTDLPATVARAQELTESLKVVKVTVHPKDQAIRYHVEMFLDSPASAATLDRSLAALRNAHREFHAAKQEPRRLDA